MSRVAPGRCGYKIVVGGDGSLNGGSVSLSDLSDELAGGLEQPAALQGIGTSPETASW
jgi:hypothetical protein